MKQSLLILLMLIQGATYSFAQLTISPAKGYDHDIGNMISMLEDLRARIIRSTEGLNQAQTDFLLDEKANRIGAMIMHLAATEVYYQAYTFERRSFNEEEKAKWETALYLGEDARNEFVGKPISYYLDAWTEVRVKTKELLKTKDDDWFSSNIEGEKVSNHWAWFHVMEHQANHMGQINMLRSRLPE
ncbi:DinB family protein [Algoriphagus halophytocola]|uniref:DinB family protein n=1 Tax=Algoriphagus halophytocola TaxID=2991499 RepID=A0ABY6MIL4_9BACT|nr:MULTISPECIES: DinB family protein [unclassified Algoriphagus]UZD23630.1 DinB family protein [Algoriphagus sp. TR-M5]WBL44923.1 DinB family protein [Algoriphagus sp. TR-M9]